MDGSAIPDQVRTFMCEHVRSYENLALLALLYRHRDAPPTVSEAARELGLAEAVVVRAATSLAALGVVAATEKGAYTYAPQSDELACLAACAARLHDEQLAEVIQVMNERAIDRVRESVARHFRLIWRFTSGRGRKG